MKRFATAIVLLSASVCSVARAADSIEVTPPDPTTEDEVTVTLNGAHPGCLLHLDPPLVVGRTITLRAFSALPVGTACPAAVFPFTESWNVGTLPSGEWTVYYVISEVLYAGPDPEDAPAGSAVQFSSGFQVAEAGPARTGYVGTTPRVPTSGAPFNLDLQGGWSDTCVPTVTGVRREGRDLVVTAQGSRENCLPFVTGWHEFGVALGPQPAGEYGLRVEVEGSAFSAPGRPFVWAESRFAVWPIGTPERLHPFGLEAAGDPTGELQRMVASAGLGEAEACASLRFERTEVLDDRIVGVVVLEPGCASPSGRLEARSDPFEVSPGEYVLRFELADRRQDPGTEPGLWIETAWVVEEEPWVRRLIEDRFRVEVTFVDAEDRSGKGEPVSDAAVSDRSVLFSFFREDNWEMLVKVLDGCDVNGHFWVFGSASTDVAYALEVTDTWSGRVRRYENAAGQPAAALTDNEAFATCDAVPEN